MALFGAGEATDEVDGFSLTVVAEGKASDDAGVGVEVGISVEGNAWIAGGDVENGVGGGTCGDEAGDLAVF